MIRKISILLFFIVLIPSACNKDSYNFPYVPINLDLGLYSDLGQLGPMEVMFKDGYGVKGLIIFRDADNGYYVFDRACTFEQDFSCALNKDTSYIQVVTCPCCKSRYLLGESADPINQSPSIYPLKRYNASIQGDFLRIIN